MPRISTSYLMSPVFSRHSKLMDSENTELLAIKDPWLGEEPQWTDGGNVWDGFAPSGKLKTTFLFSRIDFRKPSF